MTDTQRPSYALGAGVFGSSRLDLQYYQIQQTYDGHLLDPSIPYDTPGLKIADVCCGTGYFFINIQTHPSAELHAFDIDLSKLPPETFLPHVKRHAWDVNDPPPPEFLSTFDIVNVQLLFTFITDQSIDTVLRNILSILKPAGHIQWLESYARGQQVISPDPTYTPQYLPLVFPAGFDVHGLEPPSWPIDLDEVFSRNGVDVLVTDRRTLDPPHYRSWTLQQTTTWQETLAMFRRTYGGTEEGKKKVQAYAELVERCTEEAHVKGVAHVLPFVRVVGRKRRDENVEMNGDGSLT